jgi:hypothetical protein
MEWLLLLLECLLLLEWLLLLKWVARQGGWRRWCCSPLTHMYAGRVEEMVLLAANSYVCRAGAGDGAARRLLGRPCSAPAPRRPTLPAPSHPCAPADAAARVCARYRAPPHTLRPPSPPYTQTLYIYQIYRLSLYMTLKTHTQVCGRSG